MADVKEIALLWKSAMEELMSRFWANNPELLDEKTIQFLPEEWKDKVESGEIDLLDVPESIRDKALVEGERDFWGELADSARERRKYGKGGNSQGDQKAV